MFSTPEPFPTFRQSVGDYVVRCEPSDEVEVSVSAPPGTTVSVDGADPRDIDWRLGDEHRAESLTVVGDPPTAVNPFGGQHDARVVSDGSLAVHDHGSQRGRPRAVRIAIDQAKTAALLEDVRDPGAPSSSCCGSARFPSGNWSLSGVQSRTEQADRDRGTRLQALVTQGGCSRTGPTLFSRAN